MNFNHSHDKIGIWSSILCIVHCLAVPVVMAYTNNSFDLHDKVWWDLIQVFFVLIGFWAVKHAVSHVKVAWLKISFWVSFAILVASIFMHHSLLGEILNYTAAGSLVGLHTLNLYVSRDKKPAVAQA
ncbi:MAG: MerC domain-containing protein [Bacteroidia bacterium]